MRQKLFIAALVISTIFVGFFRDHVFVSLNHTLEQQGHKGDLLSITKWILTFLFSFVYLFLTAAVLFFIFHSKKYIRMSCMLYAALVGVSLSAALLGYFLSSFENTYHFIRTVMGIAQSPVPMMILIAACYLETTLRSG
jgi:hypothetical protein